MNDNQHYISKSYLDKFIHPASVHKVLYPYAKVAGALSVRGPKNLASENHFYRQVESGEITNRLDEARKKSETLYFASGKATCAPLAKCVYDSNYVPPAKDRIMLEGAAAFLWCGAPVQIHNTAMSGLLAMQIDMLNRLNSPEARAIYEASHGAEAENRINEDREAIYKGDLFADVGEENWKQLGFESFQAEIIWLDALSRMGLSICTSYPKSPFITSDNPVIVISGHRNECPGLVEKDAEVWFPISHNRGLLWSWRHQGVQKTGFGPSETRTYNRRIVKWCYREIYSPLPEDWLGDAVKNAKFDPCYGHYGSLEEVLKHSLPAIIGPPGAEVVKGEVVDLLAALRVGEKCDVVKLPARRPRAS